MWRWRAEWRWVRRRGSCSGQRWLHPCSPSALCEEQTCIECEWDSEEQKKTLYLILHFFYRAFCEPGSNVSCISICGRHLVWRPKTLVRWGFSFSLKWQHSWKCDEKTLNLAQNLRRRPTAGRRGCPNTQVELRSQSFSSLYCSKRTKMKNKYVVSCSWWFFLTNSSV